MDFQELGLNAELVHAVSDLGFLTPMPIQTKAIPVLLNGHQDFVGLAQTGTGKTAAFVLPLLQRLSGNSRRPRPGTPRALILAPTRELAAQIGESIETYGRFLRTSHTVIFGGVNQHHQVKALKRGIDILNSAGANILGAVANNLGEVLPYYYDQKYYGYDKSRIKRRG